VSPVIRLMIIMAEVVMKRIAIDQAMSTGTPNRRLFVSNTTMIGKTPINTTTTTMAKLIHPRVVLGVRKLVFMMWYSFMVASWVCGMAVQVLREVAEPFLCRSQDVLGIGTSSDEHNVGLRGSGRSGGQGATRHCAAGQMDVFPPVICIPNKALFPRQPTCELLKSSSHSLNVRLPWERNCHCSMDFRVSGPRAE